jgi:DNA-binding GntR family transcriptional regulator
MMAKAALKAAVSRKRHGRVPTKKVASEKYPQSLRDAAYTAIRHRIMTCAFKPGEFINEAQVSAMLGIGRTPVHQAIDRLMLEGMVIVLPRKGVCVKAVSLDEIMEIIDIRLLNEIYCARLAAQRASRDEVAHLSDVLARAHQWIEAGSTENLMLLDGEFHSVLAKASRNAVLADILLKLHDRSLRFWFLSLDQPGHHQAVQRQHQAILDAIKNKDPQAAEDAMRHHIEEFRRNIIEKLSGPSESLLKR